MTATREQVVYFYGKLAGATKREATWLARGSGYRVAEALSSGLDAVVLGEGAPLAETRARLAAEFDERSKLAFEKGALAIVTETEFLAKLSSVEHSETPRSTKEGATPAAVAGAVGVSVATVRRWLRHGLLAPIDPQARLPLLSAREIAVARRLAFLCSGEASEEHVEKRIRAFVQAERDKRANAPSEGQAPPAPLGVDVATTEGDARRFPLLYAPSEPSVSSSSSAAIDVGAVVLSLTLSTDGRELLQRRDQEGAERAPSDAKGQRFFDFAAFPLDGALDTPAMPPRLSPEEEQIALAERLREWNAQTTADSGTPAILAVFSGGEPLSQVMETDAFAKESATASQVESSRFPLTDESESSPSYWGERAAPLGEEFWEASDVAPADALVATSRQGRERVEESALKSLAREKWKNAASRRQVALCALAWSYEREGYWEEAVRAYRLAALAGGADPNVNVRLGKALFLLGDYSAARERFCSALELDPEYSEARVELGRAYLALGNDDDALATFRSALDARPADPLLRVELGKLFLQKGDPRAAEEEFRLAADHIGDPQLAADVRRLLATLETRRF